MNERQQKQADEIVAYHANMLNQCHMARKKYESSGELTPMSEAPYFAVLWQAAKAAVAYAKRNTPEISALPKRFEWMGVDFLLVFTPTGTVEISTDHKLNHVNLCVGFIGWADPMRVTKSSS